MIYDKQRRMSQGESPGNYYLITRTLKAVRGKYIFLYLTHITDIQTHGLINYTTSSGLFSTTPPNKICLPSIASSVLFLNTVESSNLDWQATLNSSTRDDCKEVKKSMADRAV